MLTCLCVLAAVENGGAHDALYNYIEVRVPEAGPILVEFSVHGPELAAVYGVDPTESGEGWLDNLSADEAASLVGLARRFLLASYRLQQGTKDLLAGDSVRFPSIESARSSWREGAGARPGCIAGTLSLAPTTEAITLSYGPAGKRLMLVVTRPGAFPKVHDLAPGDMLELKIPPP